MTEPTKICRVCGGVFTYDQLVQNSHCPGGVDAFCKACRRQSRRLPPKPETGTKKCGVCGKKFPYSELVKATNCSHGVRALCLACKNARERVRRDANIEQARIYEADKRKRLRAADPEGTRAKIRVWRKEHPEQYRESKRKSDRAYYARNQKRLRQSASDYAKAHPDAMRAMRARRRARKQNAEGYYTAKDVQRQFQKQGGKCWWCSNPIVGYVHADHVIPLSRGGSNWPDNIRCTCQHCNNSKKDNLPYMEWIPPNPLEPPIDAHVAQLTLL